MAEDTIIKTMDLPEGEDWALYPDLNVIVLASRLDCAGRVRAIEAILLQWRRQHLRPAGFA